VFFLMVDLAFFSANALKIGHGGWIALLIGAIDFHPDDHLEGRARIAESAAARERHAAGFIPAKPDAGIHPARAGHGGVSDQHPRRRTERPAAQPEA
jgi:hypothetical protein